MKYLNNKLTNNAALSIIGQYLIITILIVIAYLPSFSGEFILDDKALVKDNPFIKEPHSIADYFNQEDGIADERDLGNYHSGYYRPLINMTYHLDYKLWGMSAYGFRITNVILHIICCFVLLHLASQFLNKQTAFWITLLFSLHPVNTEAVSFIVSRNNIIVTLFILISLYSYIVFWEKRNYLFYILSVISFAGAVFSKEFGLMVIPLFFLFQRTLATQKSGFSKELITYIPFFMVAFLYLLFRKSVTESVFTMSGIDSLWSRIYFAPFIVFYNLKLIFFPYGLHFIYLDYPENIFNFYSAISFLFFLLGCFAIWKIRKYKLLIFSILAFFIFTFPTLNIIASPSVSLVGMRWLYVSTGFIIIGIGYFLQKALIYRQHISVSLLIVIICYLGGYTFVLNKGLWHDDDTFMKQEVFGFNNYLFASDIAEMYFNNKQYHEAEKYFKVATEKFPYRAYSYINLSALYIETGRTNEAITLLNRAKRLVMTHHEQGQWYNNMGTALINIGNNDSGLGSLRKAVIYAPSEPLFWANLGAVYGMIGDYINSIKSFKRGLDFSPESVELRTNLALTYINQKEFKEAINTLNGIPENRRSGKEILKLLELASEGMKADRTEYIKLHNL